MSRLILHVIHSLTCKEALADPDRRRVATMSVPEEALPHSCLPGGYAFETVLVVSGEMAPHEYQPGNLTMPGARWPLCRHCRNPKGAH